MSFFNVKCVVHINLFIWYFLVYTFHYTITITLLYFWPGSGSDNVMFFYVFTNVTISMWYIYIMMKLIQVSHSTLYCWSHRYAGALTCARVNCGHVSGPDSMSVGVTVWEWENGQQLILQQILLTHTFILYYSVHTHTCTHTHTHTHGPPAVLDCVGVCGCGGELWESS